MHVVIVGACGYVGSIVYEHLIQQNIRITCYDITDPDVYPPHIQKKSSDITASELSDVDVVLYFAGIVRREDCDRRPLDSVMSINVAQLTSLVSILSDHQLCIYASTAALYNGSGMQNESDTLDQSRYRNYEKSMYQREYSVQSLGKKTVGLRFGSIVGLSKNMKHEPLHNALYSSAFSSKKVTVRDPLSKRSILCSGDLLRLIDVMLVHKDVPAGIYNVASFNTSIVETASFVADQTGSELIIVPGESTEGFHMNMRKVSSTFNFKFEGSDISIHKLFTDHREGVVSNPVDKHLKCLVCMSPDLESVVDLGTQPLANNFLPDPNECDVYPLHLYRCRVCTHTQLDYLIDRTSLFKNYLYKSGTSATMRAYFSDFADVYTSKIRTSGTRTVFEIACNDGSQLDEFARRGWTTLGVDPAENIVSAIKPPHRVECKFWGKDELSILNTVKVDLIVAQNVFAHVNNPIDFLRHCVTIMTDDTLLVIQTSQANMFFNNEFDTIYHEHISFFTIRSMMRAVESVGCYLDNVYKVDVHGSSYVFEIRKGYTVRDIPLLTWETEKGLYTDSIYSSYRLSVTNMKTQALELLSSYQSKHYTIIGYGAAAKGITFLNFIFDSRPNVLCPKFIVDDSPLKIGTYSPGTLIPIKPCADIKTLTSTKILMVILAWNFADEIIQRSKAQMPPGIECIYLRFFPTIKLESGE
jgi:nucleoside-diphosphate-sugar epimerase